MRIVTLALRKVFRIGTVRYNWPMSAHASQAFSMAHCTDSEDLPTPTLTLTITRTLTVSLITYQMTINDALAPPWRS